MGWNWKRMVWLSLENDYKKMLETGNFRLWNLSQEFVHVISLPRASNKVPMTTKPKSFREGLGLQIN